MAAKRARPEKKVLSRQEIASRKKALVTRRVEGGGAGRRRLRLTPFETAKYISRFQRLMRGLSLSHAG